MTDEQKRTTSRTIEPVPIAIIGTGDGSRLHTGTEAATPGISQPNLVVQVITPMLAISVRFVHVFLMGLLGILTGAMASDVIPASDFLHLAYKCAGLALAGAGVGLIKDCVTVFGRLEGKFPLVTGSV